MFKLFGIKIKPNASIKKGLSLVYGLGEPRTRFDRSIYFVTRGKIKNLDYTCTKRYVSYHTLHFIRAPCSLNYLYVCIDIGIYEAATFDFQKDILRLYIDFLQLCVTARGLLSELELIAPFFNKKTNQLFTK